MADRSVEVASFVTNILESLQMDMLLFNINDVMELRQYAIVMEQQMYTLASLPFPEALNKADEMKVRLKLFNVIIDLVQAQQEVLKHKDSFSTGTDILKELGFNA